MIQSLRRLKKEKSLTKDKTIRILHISPHLGGGVGRVLLNYFSQTKKNNKYTHSILCLDTINKEAKKKLLEEKIFFEENCSQDLTLLLNEIKNTDIVVIHWWNHPLLFDLLVKYTLPPCRLLIWSHVSGSNSPNNFSNLLLDYPDLFVFTTHISYGYKIVKEYENKSKLRNIWSTGGLEHISNIKKIAHEKFIVGYIGTVDFIKMYPNFIDMCSRIKIPNIQFIICGDGSNLESMRKEVKSKGLAHKFIFKGFILDLKKYLSIFDVFGYPLNKMHYGTCDQSLAEAMGVGTVPVVFNNKMEESMVQNKSTGFIVNNEESYIQAIHKLYEDKKLLEEISNKTKEVAIQRFSLKSMIENWESVFKELRYNEKKLRKWKGKYKGKDTKPIEVFFESIGSSSLVFEENINNKSKESIKILKNLLYSNEGWSAKTKGSPYHYLNFFKEDKELKYLCKILNKYK